MNFGLNRKINIGIIGMGNMGRMYLEQLSTMEACRVSSIWSRNADKVRGLADAFQVNGYTDYIEMLDREKPDAVIVATPHYQHTPVSIEALRRNIHVLVEKPLAVHVNAAKRMLDVYEGQRKTRPGLVFALIHQQRTEACWQTIKRMLQEGRLGKLMRFAWTNTGWFRPQAYFQIGNWRGIWKGEGGGVLLNQCAHNLDMMWWLFGSPQTVTARASFGKYHEIEVEDEVQALLEYDSGLIGSFIASTSECPGTDRLEIVGEYGKLVYEDHRLRLHQNAESSLDFIRHANKAFGKVSSESSEILVEQAHVPGHRAILEDFVRAIREGGTPLVPAAEGVQSLMIINGMLLSALQGAPVRLPLDGDAYEEMLNGLIRNSRFQKPQMQTDRLMVDIKDSFR